MKIYDKMIFIMCIFLNLICKKVFILECVLVFCKLWWFVWWRYVVEFLYIIGGWIRMVLVYKIFSELI